MHILCLTPALSMRTYRQMSALKARGHEVTLLYLGKGGSIQLTDVSEGFERIGPISTAYHPLHQYRTTLFPSYYRGLIERETGSGEHDLVHTCSMPDVLAASAARYSKVPKVYDVRDMVTAFDKDVQIGNYLPKWSLKIPFIEGIASRTVYRRLVSLEREATLSSDARLYVSEHTRDLALEKYGPIKGGSLLFYNYAMRSDIKPTLQKLSDSDGELHIVYEGVLSLDGYRAHMLELFERIARDQCHIHIHGIGDERTVEAYKAPQRKYKRYHLEKALPHDELMGVLTRYDAGLIPFLPYEGDQGYMDTMLPNKLFDYLAAGLCLLVPPTRSMRSFVSRTCTGHVYNGPEEIPPLDRVLDIKFDRTKFTIEEHVSKLEELYRSII